MNRYTVVADVVFQAYYEVEADSQLEAKTIIENEEDIEPFEMMQATSPMVVSVEVVK